MFFRDPRTQPAVTVRPAAPRDLEAIGDLWVELMSFHEQLDARFSIPPNGRAHYIHHCQSALRDDNFRLLVAIDDGRVIGYIMGYVGHNPPIFPTQTYGFIADVCVTNRSRRQGAGELLVAAICRWFRGKGLNNVQMNVAHGNPISQKFWRKIGCADYLDHMWLDLGT